MRSVSFSSSTSFDPQSPRHPHPYDLPAVFPPRPHHPPPDLLGLYVNCSRRRHAEPCAEHSDLPLDCVPLQPRSKRFFLTVDSTNGLLLWNSSATHTSTLAGSLPFAAWLGLRCTTAVFSSQTLVVACSQFRLVLTIQPTRTVASARQLAALAASSQRLRAREKLLFSTVSQARWFCEDLRMRWLGWLCGVDGNAEKR